MNKRTVSAPIARLQELAAALRELVRLPLPTDRVGYPAARNLRALQGAFDDVETARKAVLVRYAETDEDGGAVVVTAPDGSQHYKLADEEAAVAELGPLLAADIEVELVAIPLQALFSDEAPVTGEVILALADVLDGFDD
jgi:hypothetical protein